jgi:hypothetical protein
MDWAKGSMVGLSRWPLRMSTICLTSTFACWAETTGKVPSGRPMPLARWQPEQTS